MSDNDSLASSPQSPTPKRLKLVDTRNYYFENGLAYTKDGSDLVYNIFAHNIPNEIQEKDLVEYFEQIEGKVKMLEGTSVAYIHFKNPETAAKVLSMELHTISKPKCSFSVKACEGFLQTYTPDIGLVDLDDDTIIYLLGFLPLKDQLALVRSHTRFTEPFRMYAKAFKRKFYEDELYDQDLTITETELFFKIAGETVQALLLSGDFESRIGPNGFDMLTNWCPNLKYLEFQENSKRVKQKSFHALVSKMTKLKEVQLTNLDLNDNCFYTLKLLPELTRLTILECDKITCCNLHFLPNLRKFSITSFNTLDSSSIKSALSAMPNLKSLSLAMGYYSGNEDYDDNDSFALKHVHAELVDNLATICKNIEILTINLPHTNIRGIIGLTKLKSLKFRLQPKNMNADLTNLCTAKKDQLTTLKLIDVYGIFSNYNLISQFKNLKTLHLPEKNDHNNDDSYSINDKDLEALSSLENLVEFKIIGQHDITNNGLLNYIDKCRKLKWINIMGTRINNEFAKSLLPLLKEMNRPNGRITFLVRKSKMKENQHFPEEYKRNEIKKMAIFIFEQLATTLKSYDNFEDPFDKDYNLDILSFFTSES